MNIEKLILKVIWKNRRPRIANTILKKKNEVGGLMLLDFKPCRIAPGMENVALVKQANRSM